MRSALSRFVVADVFQLMPGRCVLLHGFSSENPARVGDCLILRRPDGSFLRSIIRGVEMINYRPRPEPFCAPISLPSPLTSKDVPVGTIVTVLPPPAQPDDVFLFEVASSRSSEEGVALSGAVQQVAPGARLVLVRPNDTTCGARVLSSSAGELMVALSSASEAPRGTLVFAAAR